MPRSRRMTMTAAVALVLAVPALGAFAQEGLGDREPVEAVSPSASPTPDMSPTPELSPAPEDSPTPEDDPSPEEFPTPEDSPALEVSEHDEGDDHAHGAVVSAAAECLPSGKALHGTGFNKGMLMRAVAQGQAVTVGEVEFEVTTPEEAAALCLAVEELAATTEAPDETQGRPDHADDARVSGPPDHAPGPPDHAPAHGRRGRQGDD